MFIKISVFIVI